MATEHSGQILPSKDIFLVRHGETDFNRRRIVQGSGIDASLNETGQEQRDAFFKAYCEHGFDKVYISKLKRTYESVQPFIDDGIPCERLAGLNEISWGAREGTGFSQENNMYYAGLIRKWRAGETHVAIEGGGESPETVQERVSEAFDYILSREDESKVLICMHGRAMRILLSTILNYPLSRMDIFAHHNLGLYQLIYTGSMFEVLRYNDITHLNGQNGSPG